LKKRIVELTQAYEQAKEYYQDEILDYRYEI